MLRRRPSGAARLFDLPPVEGVRPELNEGTAEITTPVLTWGAARDETVGTDSDTLHGSVESTPRALGVFPDGGHQTFTPLYCDFVEGNGCGDDFVSIEIAEPAAKAGVLGFLTGTSSCSRTSRAISR